MRDRVEPDPLADGRAELVPVVAATAQPHARRRGHRSPEPTEKLDRIGRNRAKWAEAGIESYRITLQYGCFCEFGDGRPVDVRVVDGEVVDVVADGKPVRKRQWQGFPMTVEALFDYAEAAKADADEFDIEFDRVLGYPRMISVDQILNADDDEFQVDVTSLTPAS